MRCLGIVTCVLGISLFALAQAPKEKRDSHAPTAPVDQAEMQALTNDIGRMRTLVQQMEMNLAFVQTTQTPLKHQFELEIEMWQVLLGDMERRVQHLRGGTTSGVVPPDTVPLRRDSRQGRP
jgi:hypothetical protein